MTNRLALKSYPCVLSIAGSDSSGGAGIQADLKTFSSFQCYGASVITAITAQNTLGVMGVYELSQEAIASQLDCVLSDIEFNAIKIGMLSSIEIIKTVARKLSYYKCKNIVLDPVMLSKNKCSLLNENAIAILITELFPLAAVVTPNLPEAEALLAKKITKREDIENAAIELMNFGSKSVLIKGGHLFSEDVCADCLAFRQNNKNSIVWLERKRTDTNNTHGTGCTFSASLAACLAQGMDLVDSFEVAKNYISKAIELGSQYRLGNGMGPVCHFL